MGKRYCVIDIGTRGIRLLIADAKVDGTLNFIKSTGDLSDLGKDADKKGNLSRKSIERLCLIIKDYLAIASEYGVNKTLAVATEVVRKAPNKEEFISVVNSIVPLRILSQEYEASYSFLASAEAFKKYLPIGSTLLVIDQGGGSTELSAGTIGKNGDVVLTEVANYKLGTVELSEMFVKEKSLSIGFNNVLEKVRADLERKPLNYFLNKEPTITVGIGSALTHFVKAVYQDDYGFKPRLHELHGHITKTSIINQKIMETQPALSTLTQQDFGGKLSKDSEFATLVSGITTYHEILRKYDIQEIFLSRHGMRYGVLLHIAGKTLKRS